MKFLWLKNIAYLYFVIAGCIVVEVKENSFYFKQPSLFFFFISMNSYMFFIKVTRCFTSMSKFLETF